LERIDRLLEGEKGRYQDLIRSSAPERDEAIRLRAAAQRVQDARG
jgi:hypothetical protein